MNPGISCFVWCLLHRKTPTEHWVQKIGVNLASRCSLCLNSSEDDLHLLFLCPFSANLSCWMLNVLNHPFQPFPSTPSSLWSVLASGLASSEKLIYPGSYLTVTYAIWFHRNDVVFNGADHSPARAKSLIKDWILLSIANLRGSNNSPPL